VFIYGTGLPSNNIKVGLSSGFESFKPNSGVSIFNLTTLGKQIAGFLASEKRQSAATNKARNQSKL
jgi:hypothetical protein